MFGTFQFGTSYFAQAEETSGGAVATFNGFQLALTFGNANASALVAGGGSGKFPLAWPATFRSEDRHRYEPPVVAAVATFDGDGLLLRQRRVKGVGQSSQNVLVHFPPGVTEAEQDELLYALAVMLDSEDPGETKEVVFSEAPRRRPKAPALIGADAWPGW